MKKIQLLSILVLSGAVLFGGKETDVAKAKVNFKESVVARAESTGSVADLVIDSEKAIHGLQFDISYNPSEITSITVIAKIFDPSDDNTLFSDAQTVFAGNQFAYNANNIASLDLALETNTLVLDGQSNSITMQATVRDANGTPVEGIPVSFANATSYGTFATNNVLSGADGIAANTLQNIVTPNPSVLESIAITAYVFNSDSQENPITNTQTLDVGEQIAFVINLINEIDLTVIGSEELILDESSDSLIVDNSFDFRATVRDANGNPIEGALGVFAFGW